MERAGEAAHHPAELLGVGFQGSPPSLQHTRPPIVVTEALCFLQLVHWSASCQKAAIPHEICAIVFFPSAPLGRGGCAAQPCCEAGVSAGRRFQGELLLLLVFFPLVSVDR